MEHIKDTDAALLKKITELWGKLSRDEAATYFSAPEIFYNALQREYAIDRAHADAALHDLFAHAAA